MKNLFFIIIFLFLGVACTQKNSNKKEIILPELPVGVQAISLLGDTLYPLTPYDNSKQKYEEVREIYMKEPAKADNVIWYGRWAAYTGDYRKAITIFTEGIQKFPKDARFYRHRGHRYISVREFDKAINDFKKAVALIEGKEDVTEPDGQPNAYNIPISSLHTNIWYHLGLAYYLKYDFENALYAYKKGLEATTNDDMKVAFTHWYYMALKRTGKNNEAEKVLESITSEMKILENMAYHKLCLFYKGETSIDELTGGEFSKIMNDAAAYGIANWYYYNNEKEKAKKELENILETKVWASFGYIAAEADYYNHKKL